MPRVKNRINWSAKDVSMQLGDIQRAYIFEVNFVVKTSSTDISKLLLANGGEVVGANTLNKLAIDTGTADASTAIMMKYMARSVTIPTIQNQPIESQVLGVKIKHPGMTDFGGTFDIEFEEYESAKLAGVITPWMNLMTNFSTTPQESDVGRFGLADIQYKTHRDIKIDIEVIPYKYQGNPTGIVYVIQNAYPATYTPGQYGTESASSVRPSVSFSFDWMTCDTVTPIV